MFRTGKGRPKKTVPAGRGSADALPRAELPLRVPMPFVVRVSAEARHRVMRRRAGG